MTQGPFQRIVIVGLGLIGGSLAQALRKQGQCKVLVGVDRDADNLRRALESGVVDAGFQEVEEALMGADLVVLCVPVGSMLPLAREMAPYLAPGTLVTDVGSVKGPWVAQMEEALPAATPFVGGHPIAGRERSGLEAATPDLFQGVFCVLTPTPQTDPEALARVTWLWEGVGARIIQMDPDTHDRIFAAVSHLPHLVAYALVDLLVQMEAAGDGLTAYAAGGLRDFTRIAASHPEMWRDIFLMNRDQVLRMLDRYQDILSWYRERIAQEDGQALYEAFSRARKIRELL